jgi:uncharacterized protein YciI
MCILRLFLVAAVLIAFGAPVMAQASAPVDSSRLHKMASGAVLKKYYFVMLIKGARRDEIKDTASINNIQRGHMANMERLHKMGKLVVAGPFDEDINWRGIFVFDCNTEAEVKTLLATDPAIAAGRLDYEIHAWWTQQGAVFK